MNYRNRVSNYYVERPYINWNIYKEGFSAYSMLDENCDDVSQVKNIGTRWQSAWMLNSFGVHLDDEKKLSYSFVPVEGGLRFMADNLSERWIYLLSHEELPDIYAVDFVYIPHTSFVEQLQLNFAAESLAKRHRFILEFGEKVFYHIVENGRFLNRLFEKKCTVSLHVPLHVRLEVVGNVFTLLFDNKVMFCIKDCTYKPQTSRNALLFWNDNKAPFQTIDFELRNLKILIPVEYVGKLK